MKRMILFGTFAAITSFVGCADGPLDYRCTVTWCDGKCAEGGTELDSATYDYANVEEAGDAVAMCEDEQASDTARPDAANAYSCDCESK